MLGVFLLNSFLLNFTVENAMENRKPTLPVAESLLLSRKEVPAARPLSV